DREASGPSRVGDGAGDRSADPPRRVGREAKPEPPVEAVDRLHEADVPLLHEVEQRHPRPAIALGDGHDEPEVALNETLPRLGAGPNLRLEVVPPRAGPRMRSGQDRRRTSGGPDGHGQAALLLRAQQRVTTDVPQLPAD